MQGLGFLSTLPSGLLSKTLKISVNTVKKVSTLEWNLSLQGFLYPLLQGEVDSFCQRDFYTDLGNDFAEGKDQTFVGGRD